MHVIYLGNNYGKIKNTEIVTDYYMKLNVVSLTPSNIFTYFFLLYINTLQFLLVIRSLLESVLTCIAADSINTHMIYYLQNDFTLAIKYCYVHVLAYICVPENTMRYAVNKC